MKQRAFTIVELLIVIVVIGILAAITIVAYNGIQQRARDSKRVNDLAAIEKAFKLYGAETGNDFSIFSAGSGGTETGWFDTAYSPYVSIKAALEATNYLNGNIVDPKNIKLGGGSVNQAYMMSRCTTIDDTTRVVMAYLENPPSQTIAQQTSPYVCNDGSFASFTGPTTSSGYGMNYVRVITIK